MVHVDFPFFFPTENVLQTQKRKILSAHALKRHPKFRNLALICCLFMQGYASGLTSGFLTNSEYTHVNRCSFLLFLHI